MADFEKKRKGALLVIFITVFIDLVGFGIIIPLMPYLARTYGASAFEVGMLMTVYSLMQFIFAPFWGALSDKIGRRPIILISLLGSSLSYLGFAFGTAMWMLFVSRIFAGIFGANISTAMAYIADVTDKKDRSKGMGLIGAAFGLGFIFGPFLGGVFGDWGMKLGSEPPFGMNFSAIWAAGICFANLLLATKVLKESRQPESDVKQKKPSRLLLILEHIRKPVSGKLIFVFFLTGLAMAHMEATLFLFVKDKFNWGLQPASFGFAYVGLVMVFTQGYLIRKVLPKFGEKRVMLFGIIAFSIGMTCIGLVETIPLLGVVMTLLAVGSGLTNPSLLGSISLLSSSDEQGGVMGVTQSLASLGRILGPLFGGYFYDSLSITTPFFVAGGLIGLGFILVIPMLSKIPDSAKA